MALLDPPVALVISFGLLAVLLFKRYAIGLALFSCALVMSLLSMEPAGAIEVFFGTVTDSVTISLVLVTIGIMLLSLLYRETQALASLNEGFNSLLRNPKLIITIVPAFIGLLNVPGGALLSAPLIDAEAEKLQLKEDRKTFVNIWFRHIIFPIYPMSQVLILTAALTNTSVVSIIGLQIPVVITMAVIGYLVVLKQAVVPNDSLFETRPAKNPIGSLIFFSPILVMILAVAILGLNVAVAAFIGIFVLVLMTRPEKKVIINAASDIAIYKIALAAFGAMWLRNVMLGSQISEIIGKSLAAFDVSEVFLLMVVPAFLGFLVGLPSGSVAISVSILAGVLDFTPSTASLLYISAFFGYLVAPTHLCLALTADYFKCPLKKIYRLLVPSLMLSFIMALFVYYIS